MRWIHMALIGMLVSVSVGLGQAPSPKKGEAPAMEGQKVGSKTFEQWTKEFGIKDPSRRETAVRAVLLFPPEVAIKAVPGLVGELKKHTGSAHVDLSVRVNICIVLSELFRNGQKVDFKTEAAAINAVRPLLHDNQAIMRFRAAQTIAAIGQEARVVIPDLIVMLKDQSTWEIRQVAAAALAQVGWDKKGPRAEVVQALFATLGDVALQVRLEAVRSLSIIGPTADPNGQKAFVNALMPIALKDPEPPVQIWARVAIAVATNDFSDDSLAPIGKLMKHEEPQVRSQAVQAAGMMGTKAKSLFGPVYNRLNNDPDPGVVLMAIWALVQMKANIVNVIAEFERIAADPKQHELVRKAAKDAVTALQK